MKHDGYACPVCRKATGKESMCTVGRANYEAYLRKCMGDEEYDRIQAERHEMRRKTAEDDAAHPWWSIEKWVNHGAAIWVHRETGERRGVGLTGRPWFRDCKCAACASRRKP